MSDAPASSPAAASPAAASPAAPAPAADSPTPAKRQRKQVDFFKAAPVAEKKDVKVGGSGKGTKLVEYEFFVQELTKHRGDEDLVKSLHQLMYGSAGKKTTAKQNLREFSGFTDDVSVEDKTTKVMENKKKWTVALLKDAMGLFGLEKGGNRDDLCRRLVEYLAAPHIINGGSGGKRARASSSKSPAKKARKAGAAPKKKRAPTSYLLFCAAHREEVKAEHPGIAVTEVIKVLSEMWNSASTAEKKKFQDLAAEAKAKLAAEESEEEAAEEGEGSEGEEGEEDGEESDDFAESDAGAGDDNVAEPQAEEANL